jgi:hypothetical protein
MDVRKLDFMKHIIIFIMVVLIGIVASSSCGVDFNHGKRPSDFPNTRWVSQEPDIFFEIEMHHRVTYAQITIDSEIMEIYIGFDYGAGVYFELMPTEENQENRTVFSGLGRFSSDKLILRRSDNCQGFLDDSIIEIIFIREDLMNPIYTVGYPSEGIWVNEDLGITVDFDNEIVRIYVDLLDEHEIDFKGTIKTGGEMRELRCRIYRHAGRKSEEYTRIGNGNGFVEFSFTNHENKKIYHRGFFRFRYDEQNKMTFITGNSLLRYIFVRQETHDED